MEGARRVIPVCFGLAGGLGNAVFCLPAIKALAQDGPVDLVVGGDYGGMLELFRRCVYARKVLAANQAPRGRFIYIAGQYSPTRGYPRFRTCGWPVGEKAYPHPEWFQVLRNAASKTDRVDVTDWLRPKRDGVAFDVGLVPGCKPGSEWYRKRYPRMAELARVLTGMGCRVTSYGQREEIVDAALEEYWSGPCELVDLPERLLASRVIVGTDSGVTHLASSLGVPTVMLFTSTSERKGDPVGPPARNRKLSLRLECAPCQSTPRWRECSDWRCREIPVADILSAIEDLAAGRLRVITET